MQNRQLYLLLFLISLGVLHGKPLEKGEDTPMNYDVNLEFFDRFHYSSRTNKGASANVREIESKDDPTIEEIYGVIYDGSSVPGSTEDDENGFRPHVVEMNLPETTTVIIRKTEPEIDTACLASLSGGGCG